MRFFTRLVLALLLIAFGGAGGFLAATKYRPQFDALASQFMEPRLCTLAVPVRDAGGNYVAGLNVIVQGRLMTNDEMAGRFLRPMQDAALEFGALLLP